jgi:hypothetical protein
MKTKLLSILTLTPAFAVMLALPGRAAPGEATASAESNLAEVRGDAAKVALKELDAEIDRIDALEDNAPTPEDKAAAKARLEVLKDRRNELRKTYVAARYDELKADVRAEADKVGAWTKHTFTRDPASKVEGDMKDSVNAAKHDARVAGDAAYANASSAAAAMDLSAYKLQPTDTNKDQAKAALKALSARINELDDRADKMPHGAERDAEKARVKALEKRKDELKHQFDKARFDSLIDDVQGEWNQAVH